jgi:hypothetical protein
MCSRRNAIALADAVGHRLQNADPRAPDPGRRQQPR